MAEPGAGAGPTKAATETQTAWLAGLLAVVTALVTVGLFARLSDSARWAPFVGWLLAGAVAGMILRHRGAAMRVAVLSTVVASATTGILAWVISRPQDSAQKHPGYVVAPTVSEILLMTLLCSLAAVLGAAGIVEYYRWRDQQA